MKHNSTHLVVAARYLYARAFQETEVASWNHQFKNMVEQFQSELGDMLDYDPNTTAYRIRNERLRTIWRDIFIIGRNIAQWAIETRAIPKGKTKAVEMAVRLFTSAKYIPPDMAAWWDKNGQRVLVLLEATRWPARTTDQDAIVNVAPFVVHNTLNLTGDKLKGTIETIERAIQILKSKPKFSRVLYGDVFVVGQLRASKTLAWYFKTDDTVFLRPHLKIGRGEVHNLIHELGHRYWFQFMTKEQQGQWNQEYIRLKSGAPNVKIPEAGSPLGIRVEDDPNPVVKFVGKNQQGALVMELVSGIRVSVKDVVKLLHNEAIEARFPTAYATASYTEFFAEAFAFYAMGNLSPELTTKLETILGL